jgi:hypothetical protein
MFLSGLNAPCWQHGCIGTITSSDASGKYQQRGTEGQFVLQCGHCHSTRRVGSQEDTDPLHQQLLASMAMTGADLPKWCLIFHLVGIPLEAHKGQFKRAKEAVQLYAQVHSDIQERRIRMEVVHAAIRGGKTTVDLAADGNADQRAHNGRSALLLYCPSTSAPLLSSIHPLVSLK